MTELLETVARAFIAQADAREFSLEEAETFFREHEVLVSFVACQRFTDIKGFRRSAENPLMIIHDLGDDAVGIPPIRVAMAQFDTSRYFTGHNGIDLIRGFEITKLPILHRELDDSWVVAEKGIIDPQ